MAEALLPVVLAEAETEKTPGKLKYQFVTIKHSIKTFSYQSVMKSGL